MKRCLLGLIGLVISISSFGQSLETDRQALVAIYTKANGPDWGLNWVVPGNTGDNPCGWDGVTCAGGRVTRLRIDNIRPATLPVEIGNLSELTHLIMNSGYLGPGFMGNIPAEIGNLSKLEYLDLMGNVFNADGISAIGSLTSLKQLHMTLPGNVPSTFANLVNLERCTLGRFGPMDGQITIAFPDAIYQWSKIKFLRMAGVIFSTPMSSQIGNLTTLDSLELTRSLWGGGGSGDPVWGSIPAEMGNLTNLRYLNLSSSGLTGQIPSSLSLLSNLEVLDLSYNALTETIPAVTNFTKIKRMDLSNNELVSMIPDLSAIPLSANVNIANNKFSFSGMENNIAYLDTYSPQKDIRIAVGFPTGPLNAEAGGMISNNVYKWYFQDQLIFTGNGNSELMFSENGLYKVQVTNALVPGLVLKGEVDATILPVTLISFEGKSQDNQTKLTWKTTSETNNKGFEIERSADARTFEKIGFVDGSGDSKENQFYHFTDLDPFAKSYYRLKQLDYDGKFEYSTVIAVKGEGAILKVYPNPAQEYLTISGIAQKQFFSITDQSGRIVLEGQVADKGQISIKNLVPGRYVVRIDGESSRLLIHR
ncbi:Por secretion system C-terminal sorting domain-containing protein [Dyadobacter soli]|uniref:Por secretion system C-terminal sorting domain-containing protein n=1 Tax=Dyadobacter soli TaxID=659014 RepID=A0A1G7RDX1_9BACT|nr:T9SS type A sorting domain-containing protein [Dyadobacter soli]SDG08996.1 Por secretion system C-terminal sorting domain-containing protein [Dyadobacter soli]